MLCQARHSLGKPGCYGGIHDVTWVSHKSLCRIEGCIHSHIVVSAHKMLML